MRPRSNDLHVGAAIMTGRRFVPPPTPVPIVMGEEPWRERPRLRAMNLCRARSRVVHATVPGGRVCVVCSACDRTLRRSKTNVHQAAASAARWLAARSSRRRHKRSQMHRETIVTELPTRCRPPREPCAASEVRQPAVTAYTSCAQSASRPKPEGTARSAVP